MIGADEIRQKSAEFGIHTSNVQRDYVFGWLLSGIYSVSELKGTLVLKGGNALRKAYFASARFSDDLDFTTEGEIDETFLMNELNAVCRFVQERTSVQFDLDRNQVADEHNIKGHKKVYKVRLYFKDFLGAESTMTIRIRMDVTEFDKIYLPVQKRLIIHPYSDLAECQQEITCVKLEEAMADKLKCLLQRRSSYDLFDLFNSVFVKQELEVARAEIVTTFLKKSIFEPSPIAAKNLLLGIPFDLVRRYWDTHVICHKDAKLSFDDAVSLLRAGIEELFADFAYGAHHVPAFYPAHLRNPILEAGTSQTLLKLTYNGHERMVEPYSLAYKRRLDGVAQEYLYVWDRTGGTSDPGIKAMLQAGMSRIENTEEKFDPRFEVEIAKAGETPTNSYFAGSFGRSRSRSTGARSRIGYTLKCSYCGKRFRRTTYSTRLNKHMDTYGNRCYGRMGSII